MKKGITLIALIITVIILLILAGTAISIAINGGDIFGKASTAREQWNESVLQEESSLTSLLNSAEEYTDGRWIIAWVYDGSHWSNPFYRDEELANHFDFNSSEQGSYEFLDTDYSISSIDEIEGSFTAKLYTNGELRISGVGILPTTIGGGHTPSGPWNGNIHVKISNGETDITDYEDLKTYIWGQVTKIILEEGITEIPDMAFNAAPFTSYEFPSTLTTIDEDAFAFSQWVNNLYYTVPGYYDSLSQTSYVNIVVNGIEHKLVVGYT